MTRQIEQGEEYLLYCDDGKSAKDVGGRPAFQQMMGDAKDGLIERIIVKKYDRFSRNLRDYLNITNELDSYGVSVFSLTEPFNTATKEERLMRNNLLGFAEFERETIAARVADAYVTRATETGFFQGGTLHYGYMPERRTVNGKTGSVLVPSETAHIILTAFELYKNQNFSLYDIIVHFKEKAIDIGTGNKARVKNATDVSGNVPMGRDDFSRILASPLYVRADAEVYQYLVSKGYKLLDDVEAYDGEHGLFRHNHKRSDAETYIKVGYHEGIVDSETWLAVQDKKSHNRKVPSNGTAKSSWLTGITKCGNCGYSIATRNCWNRKKTKMWRYYIDKGYYTTNSCGEQFLQLRPDEAEQAIFEAMKERLESLVIAKTEKVKPDTESEKIKVEITRLDDEIRKLMEKLAMRTTYCLTTSKSV